MKNKDETDPQKIEKMIAHGEYVVKEMEALYMLKKYRTLKRRYYDGNPQWWMFFNQQSKDCVNSNALLL